MADGSCHEIASDNANCLLVYYECNGNLDIYQYLIIYLHIYIIYIYYLVYAYYKYSVRVQYFHLAYFVTICKMYCTPQYLYHLMWKLET